MMTDRQGFGNYLGTYVKKLLRKVMVCTNAGTFMINNSIQNNAKIWFHNCSAMRHSYILCKLLGSLNYGCF